MQSAQPSFAAGFVCAIALAAGAPTVAGAQVLTTDNVCGKTANARGITVENLPDIDATNALVMGKDGTVYYGRGADEQVKIASITRVMTAILTVENCKMDEKVTVSNAAATVGNSTAGLLEGDELTVEQALRGLMIPSGNDAAIVLAEYVGKKIDPKTKDAEATFVKAMNERAKKLGCTGTLFENPHGLDFDEWAGDMHSTAHDVALMMQEAMKNDTIREVVASEDSWIEVTGADGTDHSHSMDTHNYLLGQDGNIGGKDWHHRRCRLLLYGCLQPRWRRDLHRRFELHHHRPALYRYRNRLPIGTTVTRSRSRSPTRKKDRQRQPLMARISQTDWTDKTIDATLADPTAQATVFSLAGEVTERLATMTFRARCMWATRWAPLRLSRAAPRSPSWTRLPTRKARGRIPLSGSLVSSTARGRRIDYRPLAAESETVAKAPGCRAGAISHRTKWRRPTGAPHFGGSNPQLTWFN